MGLDNVWRKSGKNVSIKGEFNLVGGGFSGFGNDSFSGKVYNDIIEKITGESLYQYEIPNETVRKIASKLESTIWEENLSNEYVVDKEEYSNLCKMFKAHAEAGHTLHGYW